MITIHLSNVKKLIILLLKNTSNKKDGSSNGLNDPTQLRGTKWKSIHYENLLQHFVINK